VSELKQDRLRKNSFFLGRLLRQFKTSFVPEFIDPVFAQTSPKRSFLIIENERFGLVSAKTGSKNSGIGLNGCDYGYNF
jgi:hypothetical protein